MRIFDYLNIIINLILSLLFALPVHAETIIIPWNLVSILPYTSASHVGHSILNKIIIIGGSATSGGSHNEIIGSAIQTNGQLNEWLNISILPKKLIWHSSTDNNSFIYILGGFLDNIDGVTSNVNSVFKSAINSDGSISSWQEVTPLPKSLSLGASAIFGNKIYFAGGNPTPTYNITTSGPNETNQNVYMATINPDGAIGNWESAGLLPERLIGFGMMEINGYLYILGGKNSNNPIPTTTAVRRALINNNGTIGPWENESSLPVSIWRFGVTKVGNIVITAGGQHSASDALVNVFYTTIDTDGKMSPWQYGPALPYATAAAPLVSWNNKIYLLGGHDSVNYTSNVYMSEISEITQTPPPTSPPYSNSNYSPYPHPNSHLITIIQIIFYPWVWSKLERRCSSEL